MAKIIRYIRKNYSKILIGFILIPWTIIIVSAVFLIVVLLPWFLIVGIIYSIITDTPLPPM